MPRLGLFINILALCTSLALLGGCSSNGPSAAQGDLNQEAALNIIPLEDDSASFVNAVSPNQNGAVAHQAAPAMPAQGAIPSSPQPDNAEVVRHLVLENAATLHSYSAQSGDADKPFVQFPNQNYQRESSCLEVETNTPFTGIVEIDAQINAWSADQLSANLAQLEQACEAGQSGLTYYLHYETSVTRGQGMGVAFFSSLYTGGAHPMNDVATMNFRMSDGHQLAYDDLFANTAGLLEFLSGYAQDALRPSLGQYWQDDVFSPGLAPTAENFKNFVITPEGLVLIFPQYQIAPYSAGVQSCMIPLESLVKFLPRPGIWQ